MSETRQDNTSGAAPQKKLSDEDMARVAAYLDSPVHRHERPPFRPWLLMAVLMVVVVGLTCLSMLYAWIHGIPPQ